MVGDWSAMVRWQGHPKVRGAVTGMVGVLVIITIDTSQFDYNTFTVTR